MFLALLFVAANSSVDVHVMGSGRPISTLQCRTGLIVSDVPGGSPATVVFHGRFAELTFSGAHSSVRDEGTMLFIYVDGAKVALISAPGPIRMVVPLDSRAHHKIVTGSTNLAGAASSAMAECT
jgi:hypothetical protein